MKKNIFEPKHEVVNTLKNRFNMMSMLCGVGIGMATMGVVNNRRRGKVEHMANDFFEDDVEAKQNRAY
ncbi:hypothetical protein [Tuberibacillus sp. Marseille-P3662]|uniref:hypothetical protein n=1 Tax=Tuberibacillus sp. Marseille-P3662 TaxID=1965358 RepID=UPI000A1CA09B|nr:hypothetical protein [Tuberibacillus sp. Marseille-P3662]